MRRTSARARRLLAALALVLATGPAGPAGGAGPARPAPRTRLCLEHVPSPTPPTVLVIEVAAVTETTLGLVGFFRGKQLQTLPLRGAARVRADGGWDLGLEVFAPTGGRIVVQGRLFPPDLGQGQVIFYEPGGGGSNPVVDLAATSCELDFLDG